MGIDVTISEAVELRMRCVEAVARIMSNGEFGPNEGIATSTSIIATAQGLYTWVRDGDSGC